MFTNARVVAGAECGTKRCARGPCPRVRLVIAVWVRIARHDRWLAGRIGDISRRRASAADLGDYVFLRRRCGVGSVPSPLEDFRHVWIAPTSGEPRSSSYSQAAHFYALERSRVKKWNGGKDEARRAPLLNGRVHPPRRARVADMNKN